MTDKIKEAAYQYAKKQYPNNNPLSTTGDMFVKAHDTFIAGATSEAAREYWEEKIISENTPVIKVECTCGELSKRSGGPCPVHQKERYEKMQYLMAIAKLPAPPNQ